jgi:hypothetical protein
VVQQAHASLESRSSRPVPAQSRSSTRLHGQLTRASNAGMRRPRRRKRAAHPASRTSARSAHPVPMVGRGHDQARTHDTRSVPFLLAQRRSARRQHLPTGAVNRRRHAVQAGLPALPRTRRKWLRRRRRASVRLAQPGAKSHLLLKPSAGFRLRRKRLRQELVRNCRKG